MTRLSDQKLMSGRAKAIGSGFRVPTPIELDPVVHEGWFVYGDDQNCYFSDGSSWVIVSSGAVRRPTGLEPLTAFQRRQLRLSKFSAAAGLGYTQVGVVFRVSLFPDMRDPFFTEVVESTTASSFNLPQNFLTAGTTFYWQGKYLATDSEESQYSKTLAQVFPDLVEVPVPLTANAASTLVLQVKPYESAFEYIYGSTSWQVFAQNGSNMLLDYQNGSTVLSLAEFDQIFVPGTTYYWRARFNDTTTISSGWTEFRSFVMDAYFTVRSTLNDELFVGRSIPNGFNNLYIVPAAVLSSDGVSYVTI